MGEGDEVDALVDGVRRDYYGPGEVDEASAYRLARLAAARGVRLDPDAPFALDGAARAWTAEHPDGATLEELGCMMGLSRERIRQLEERALAVVRAVVLDAGWSAEDVLAVLARPRGRARMP